VRWANLLFCCLLLSITIVGAAAPLHATDIYSRRQSDREDTRRADPELQVAEFCHMQRKICRKVCDLRSNFDDRFDGCPHSCDSREFRCNTTACFRWTDPDFIIAEKYGAAECALYR
jgi:hypothetical protein